MAFKYHYSKQIFLWDIHTLTQRYIFKLSFLISKIPPLKQKEINSDNAMFNALTIS